MKNEHIKIFLVENNQADVFFLQEMLSQENEKILFEVISVDNLTDACKYLEGETLDVIILDLTLPDSWGLDTFLRMYAQSPEIPIIVLTSIDDEELAIETVHQGAQNYLIKGQINRDLLARTIRYSIERHRIHTELKEKNRRLEDTLNELHETQEKLLKSERMAIIGEVALTVSHHINNPLTVLMGTLEMMLDKDFPDESKEKLMKVYQMAERIRDVVRKTTKLEDPKKVEVGAGLQMLDLDPTIPENET